MAGMTTFGSKQEAQGYLSALIDGEGWVAEQNSARGRRLYRVTIGNTDRSIIDAGIEAFNMLGITGYYVNTQDRTSSGWLPIHHLIVSNREGLCALHANVTLRCARKQAALDEQVRLYHG